MNFRFEKAIYQSGEEAILNLEISNSSRKEVSEVNLKVRSRLFLKIMFNYIKLDHCDFIETLMKASFEIKFEHTHAFIADVLTNGYP